MKNTHYLKLAIDLLFGLHIAVLITTLIITIIGTGEINIESEISSNKWLGLVQLIPILLFLLGIWFIRKVAILYIEKKSISFQSYSSMKKAGTYFLLAGGIKVIVSFIYWIKNITIGQINFSIGDETILTFILIIVGLFMLLQSKTLEQAKEYQDEINLTI